MSDIFISYSSADRERARVFAHELEQRGWSVWWDREIPPGRAYDDVIEEALDAAKCVVVLWSKASAASGWVRNEASDAMQRKVLIPALIDADVKIPLEFRRLQAADLSRWQGGSTVEFEQFCEAVARNVASGGGAKPAPAPAPSPPAPPPPPHVPPPVPPGPAVPAPASAKKSSRTMWIAIGVGVLFLAGLAQLLTPKPVGGGGAGPAPLVTPPVSEGPVAPAANINGSTAMPGNGSGLTLDLSWYDHALTYRGTLRWPVGTTVAQLSVDVTDAATHKSLGHREVTAFGRPDAPGRNVFSAQIPVNGDSTTPGPHTHSVNLVFELQANGNWAFVRNCTSPGNCFEVRH